MGWVIVHVRNNQDDLTEDVAADPAVLGDAKPMLRQVLEEAGRQGRPEDCSVVEEIAFVGAA